MTKTEKSDHLLGGRLRQSIDMGPRPTPIQPFVFVLVAIVIYCSSKSWDIRIITLQKQNKELSKRELSISQLFSYLNSSLKYSLLPSWAFTVSEGGTYTNSPERWAHLTDCNLRKISVIPVLHPPVLNFFTLLSVKAQLLDEIILPSSTVPHLLIFSKWLNQVPPSLCLAKLYTFSFFNLINQSL